MASALLLVALLLVLRRSSRLQGLLLGIEALRVRVLLGLVGNSRSHFLFLFVLLVVSRTTGILIYQGRARECSVSLVHQGRKPLLQ